MDFKQYLAYFGWSQAELARRIGVTPDTVSRWKGDAPRVVLMYLAELKRNDGIEADFRAMVSEQLDNVIAVIEQISFGGES